MVIHPLKKLSAFTDPEVHSSVIPCSDVGYHRFGGPCCLLLQSEVNDARSKALTSSARYWPARNLPFLTTPAYNYVHFLVLFTSPWRRKQHSPPKRWYPTSLNGVTTRRPRPETKLISVCSLDLREDVRRRWRSIICSRHHILLWVWDGRIM
jgi:hypothetical protein